jgi:hypothetical protein
MKRASIPVVFAAATLLSGSAAAQTTVLTHATLIDGTGAAPQRDVTIVMENGRIGAIGARILTVKYRFMSPPFIPGSEVKTPEEARAKVDEIVEKGADFVKV